ncbi:MAG: lactonase family protein [Chitinophagaceae bacterium]|nr:lactonase family protein [Chitinophagaceae bacterium]MCW5929688.1 lactonase family protein [Chitinophagaceae bacterium]
MKKQETAYYLVTGTYTGGLSKGIYVHTFNTGDGSFKEVSHIETPSPSFLAVSPDEKYVYAANELGDNDNGGEISAFAFDKTTGTLQFLNKQLTAGDHPCHVDVDKTGKWVVAGNYSSGTLSVFPVQENGSLSVAAQTIEHTGSGVNKQRQEKPHVHCTLFSADNKWLFVPDLGIDKVMIYAFDVATGRLTPGAQPFAKVEDGKGPRHITFHPNNKFAYLIEEMGGSVSAFEYIGGTLNQIQNIASVQQEDTAFIGSADIHLSPDGKFLYASNRGGLNTIAIYSVDDGTGLLTLVGHQRSGGEIPRNFTIDPSGRFLLVGNQNSDYISIFNRDGNTGLLTDTGTRITVGKPVCLKWISK